MAKALVRMSEKPRCRIVNSNYGGRAYFDSAATNRLNENHWTHASELDINTLIRGDLATVRKRACYEIANNCYGAGIEDTLADYIVGTGPRPQLDSGNPEFDAECEELFLIWADAADFNRTMEFGELLRMQICTQQCDSGESLTLFKRDPDVGPYDVGLRLLATETERLDSSMMPTEQVHDGIEFDSYGRPAAYHILKSHPNSGLGNSFFDSERVAAMDVIHLFRVKRPNQRRGIPWFAPALPLFSQLRRFTLATIDAAEAAADVAGVMKTSNPLDPDDTEDVESNDVVETERRALLTLPAGWDITQFKAEHPTTTYQMFKHEIINEIARCVNMPFNIAAANSSDYNYASGRLDHQAFFRFIQRSRKWAAKRFLNRIFQTWLTEAFLIPGYFTSRPTFAQAMRASQLVQWFWPGFKHVDPVKEANAERIRLESGTTTLKAVYAEQGMDWEKQLKQRAKELEKMKELGIPVATTKNLPIEENDDDSQTSKTKSKTEKK